MKGVLNYRVHFMNRDTPMIYVTAEEANAIQRAWSSGIGSVIIRGNVYACHQITQIIRDREAEEDGIYSAYKIALNPHYADYNKEKAKEFTRKNEKLLNIGSVAYPEIEEGNDHDSLMIEGEKHYS